MALVALFNHTYTWRYPIPTWRRRPDLDTGLQMPSHCPPGDWGPKLGPRFCRVLPPLHITLLTGLFTLGGELGVVLCESVVA